jgi:predicted DNA-binding ribbon-helix-helix protein
MCIAPTTARSTRSIEDAFWKMLKEIASERDLTVSDVVAGINSGRQYGNLSSAIRLFVLDFYRDPISEHEKRSRTREILADAPPPRLHQRKGIRLASYSCAVTSPAACRRHGGRSACRPCGHRAA